MAYGFYQYNKQRVSEGKPSVFAQLDELFGFERNREKTPNRSSYTPEGFSSSSKAQSDYPNRPM